jgi:hypothetical protein
VCHCLTRCNSNPDNRTSFFLSSGAESHSRASSISFDGDQTQIFRTRQSADRSGILEFPPCPSSPSGRWASDSRCRLRHLLGGETTQESGRFRGLKFLAFSDQSSPRLAAGLFCGLRAGCRLKWKRLRISRRAYPKPPRPCSRSCLPAAWPWFSP